MIKFLYRFSLISLICVLLVMLAGSIVRMTGSGMGCPDWPRCFGYLIPPTDAETLTWSPERQFNKGNIIIKNERLLVAREDFKAGTEFDERNWQPYTKHDYAKFNPTHTWVEFINRLIGALTGIPVLLLAVASIFHFTRDPVVTLSAWIGLLLLGFEAWLGKLVVDGNLVPHQITYHMFGALALVGIYTFLLIRLKSLGFAFQTRRDKVIVRVGILALLLLLIQIFLGTAVREEVDAIGKTNLLQSKDWIDKLSIVFKIHRSFSIVVLALVGYYALRVVQTRLISTWPRILLLFLFTEILIGIGLAYLKLPALLQPLHLMFAVFDFALVLGILLVYLRKTTTTALA